MAKHNIAILDWESDGQVNVLMEVEFENAEQWLVENGYRLQAIEYMVDFSKLTIETK